MWALRYAFDIMEVAGRPFTHDAVVCLRECPPTGIVITVHVLRAALWGSFSLWS